MIRQKTIIILLVTIVLFLPVTVALAQSGGIYDLSWSSLDGGGYTFSSGGAYTLGGTIGQPDAGLLSGGSYTLGAGFWCGGAAAGGGYEIYLPLVLRNT